MKDQFRFVLGKKSFPEVTVENGCRYIESIPEAKKELKKLVKKIYGADGWGRIERANWKTVLEVKGN